jgi:hypothetical protein
MNSTAVLRLALQVLAGVSLVLVIVNGVMALANRSTQADVNGRGQFIAQSAQLGNLERQIIQAAANAAINSKDTRLGDLLTANGIQYQAAANPPATAAQPASPAAPAPAAPAAGRNPAPAAAPAAPAGGRRP